MLRVTLEIDNFGAHSCSPREFLRTKILQDAKIDEEDGESWVTPYARINVIEAEQL